jgi:lipid-A-disaccharide synthase
MAAPFIETAKRLRAENPNLICMTLAAPTVRASVEEALADLPGMVIVTDPLEKEDCFAACDVALACSGSVTTELALQGAPMVVGYRLGAVSYAVLKRLFRPPYVTMFNIAADREIASEFIQERCTPERLAPALAALFADSAKRAAQIAAQNEALVVMGKGKPPAAEIAAGAILQVLSAAQPRLSSGV